MQVQALRRCGVYPDTHVFVEQDLGTGKGAKSRNTPSPDVRLTGWSRAAMR